MFLTAGDGELAAVARFVHSKDPEARERIERYIMRYGHLVGVTAHAGAHRELALGASICFGAQAFFYLAFWAIRRSVRSGRAAR